MLPRPGPPAASVSRHASEFETRIKSCIPKVVPGRGGRSGRILLTGPPPILHDRFKHTSLSPAVLCPPIPGIRGPRVLLPEKGRAAASWTLAREPSSQACPHRLLPCPLAARDEGTLGGSLHGFTDPALCLDFPFSLGSKRSVSSVAEVTYSQLPAFCSLSQSGFPVRAFHTSSCPVSRLLALSSLRVESWP